MAGPNRSPLIFLESTDCQISKNVVSLSAGPPMITGFSPAYPEQVLQAALHSGMPRATVHDHGGCLTDREDGKSPHRPVQGLTMP
jgi:hypothetical protein